MQAPLGPCSADRDQRIYVSCAKTLKVSSLRTGLAQTTSATSIFQFIAMTPSKSLGLCLLGAFVLGTESISTHLRGAVSLPPAPNVEQLLIIVQGLVRDIAEIKTTRSRLRHIQRRNQEPGGDVTVTQADVVLLRHYIGEMNSTLRGLGTDISNLRTQIAHVTSSQQKLEKEVRKLKRSRLHGSKRTELRGVVEKVALETDGSSARKNNLLRNWRSDQDGAGEFVTVETLLEQGSDGIRHGLQKDEGYRNVHSETTSHAFTRQGVDLDVDISGDGDGIHTDASGDDADKYVIVGETFQAELGPLASSHHHASSMPDIPYKEDNKLTTTHSTTDSHTVSTKPIPSDPSSLYLASISLLHQRLSNVEQRLNLSVQFTDDVVAALANEASRLDSEMLKQVGSIRKLEGKISDLNATLSRLVSQTARWHLEEFINGLQGSLANFTTQVLTLDQWRVASTQLMAADRRTGERVNSLTSRVRDNRQLTSKLQTMLRDQQSLCEQQFRLLQMYVIQLNNTVQDLQEQVDTTMQKQMNDVHNIPSYGADDLTLTSRLEDLAVQLLYSDNRLSHLEVRVLNASLASCQKTNNDLYQDAAIQRINQTMTNAISDIGVVRETVKRLEFNLHRLYGKDKAIREDIRIIQGQVKAIEGLPGAVQLMKKEVDNLLFQLPADCEEYYDHGFHRTGDYIISPTVGVRSIKVRCVMIRPQKDKQHEEENTGIQDSTGLNLGGGWTVIQQRHSGKVNFNRSWTEYANGFGSTDTEYWIGNDVLHLMTSSRNYSLRISMRDVSGTYWSATYGIFAVSSKEDNYRLTMGRYRGNATDSFNYSSGMTFSTYDRDTDVSSMQCARYSGGGWWYRHCQISNLNGPFDVGMIWFHRQRKDWLQLREIVMMVRCLS